MTTDTDYDAVLHHWCVVGYRSPSDDVRVILGMITGDRTRRFADGRWIMTSMLLTQPDDVRAWTIVRTLNSKYLLAERLEKSADAPRPRQ
jgi:hypothetical protein